MSHFGFDYNSYEMVSKRRTCNECRCFAICIEKNPLMSGFEKGVRQAMNTDNLQMLLLSVLGAGGGGGEIQSINTTSKVKATICVCILFIFTLYKSQLTDKLNTSMQNKLNSF